jgi:hypothetical protein
MANFWSLSGNWEFGAIDKVGQERATFKVLAKFHEMLEGMHAKTTVSSPKFDSIDTGAIAAQKGINYISSLASIALKDTGQSVLKLWVINKHPIKPVDLSLVNIGYPFVNSFKQETLTTDNYFSADEAEDMDWKITVFESQQDKPITLDPHSINLITIEIPAGFEKKSPPKAPVFGKGISSSNS